MAHARRAFTSAKRQVQWVGHADQGYVSVASGAKVLIESFSPEASNMTRPTIVRSRGAVSHRFAAVTADVAYVGSIGWGIVSEDAFAAGVASIPGPESDPDWSGWYVWRSFAETFEFNDATGGLYTSRTIEIDSKAMRKMGTNERLVVVAESQSGAFSIAPRVRSLFKLS